MDMFGLLKDVQKLNIFIPKLNAVFKEHMVTQSTLTSGGCCLGGESAALGKYARIRRIWTSFPIETLLLYKVASRVKSAVSKLLEIIVYYWNYT